jgi:hypothetical protein
MVDPNMPWSLKGISDEAREFAKLASDQSDIPVGAWLSQVIRAAAAAPEVTTPEAVPVTMPASAPVQESAPVHHAPPITAPAPPQPSPGVGHRSSTIERAAQIVDDFGFEPEGPARDADLIEDPDMLQAELLTLERRLQNAEAGTQDNLAPLIHEIERIRARLSAFGKT